MTARRLTFLRYGRAWSARIRSADELAAAVEMDEALWTATEAPTERLGVDEILLHWIDGQSKGRILAGEFRAAVRWALQTLRNHDGLNDRRDGLDLSAVDESGADGLAIRTAGRKILARAGIEGDVVPLSAVRAVLAAAVDEGDAGLLDSATVEDDAVRSLLEDVVSVTSGSDETAGVDEDRLDRFIDLATDRLAWLEQGSAGQAADGGDLYPLGDATAVAADAVRAVRAKVDEFFSLSHSVAYDDRLGEKLRPDLAALDADGASASTVESMLVSAPLAPPTGDGALPLREGMNPAYASTIHDLADKAIEPLLGRRDTLSEPDWQRVQNLLAAHDAYRVSEPGGLFSHVPPDRLREDLDESLLGQARGMLQASKAAAVEVANVRLLERLILCLMHLLDLANNFISFPYLYDSARRALFERGTLIMDGRRLSLAVDAPNPATHAQDAKNSKMYVVYVELDTEPKKTLALPVTSGRAGNLTVGKRGIFQSVEGVESFARIVQVIENPISLSEAIADPFRRVVKLIGKKVDQWTAEADKTIDAQADAALSNQPDAKPAAGGKGLAVGGMLVGGGVALAAMGSAIAYMVSTLSSVRGLIGLGVAIASILALITIRAWLRLRARDLSSILEGSGWAINTRMYLTRRQAKTFCRKPKFPPGSIRRRAWWRLVVVSLIVAGAIVAWGVWTGGRFCVLK